jgi:hypothetical protein
MTSRTAIEIRADNIEKMGDPLGVQYSALWQEVANIHLNWGEFVELYGTKPERLELINRAAGTFFVWLSARCGKERCFISRG